jgi:hypothetical protein
MVMGGEMGRLAGVVYIDRGLRVRTRTGREVSDSLPELTGLVDALDGHAPWLGAEAST